MGEHKAGCEVRAWESPSGTPHLRPKPPCTCTTTPDVERRFVEWRNKRYQHDPIKRESHYALGWPSMYRGQFAAYLAGHAQGDKDRRAVDIGKCAFIDQYDEWMDWAGGHHEACQQLAAELKEGE